MVSALAQFCYQCSQDPILRLTSNISRTAQNNHAEIALILLDELRSTPNEGHFVLY